jgi:polyisoprenoid-binding protein YceI
MSINKMGTGLVYSLGMCLFGVTGYAQTTAPLTVQVDKGLIQFDSETNLSAISVHGKSAALRAEVRAARTAEALVLEQVRATVPVQALSTGMGLRDEHMRKYIFTTADGKQPDLIFSAANLRCAAQPGREEACPVAGTLSIRGVERPFSMTLKVKQEAGSPAVFKASGLATVKLSDYGIERPSQLGVQTQDEVKLSIQFTGREAVATASNAMPGGSK